MATLKFRLNRKNSSGSYDTIHYETSSNIVMRSNGESAETALARTDSHISNRSNPHNVTASQIGAAAASHTHGAGQVTAGTLAGQVLANASAQSNVGTAQVRNIYAGTADIGAGAALASGVIYLVYE